MIKGDKWFFLRKYVLINDFIDLDTDCNFNRHPKKILSKSTILKEQNATPTKSCVCVFIYVSKKDIKVCLRKNTNKVVLYNISFINILLPFIVGILFYLNIFTFFFCFKFSIIFIFIFFNTFI